jgi:hypothetical protein
MQFPSNLDLVEAWLLAKFHGTPCIVFFNPFCEDGTRINKIFDMFNIPLRGKLLNCNIAILPHANPDSIVNRLNQEEYGFVISWTGARFLTKNS